jgi:hypothetical protein
VTGRPATTDDAESTRKDSPREKRKAEEQYSWLTAEQRAEVEDYLHKVAERLRAWQFSEPLLPVHAPTEPRSDGAEAVYRIHVNPLDDAGEYVGGCDEPDKYISVDSSDWASIADASNDGSPRLQWRHLNALMLVAGHELFHAVQAGSAAYRELCDMPGWIEEGTADAVAYDMFREFKGFKPIADNHDQPASVHGLRPYHQSLEIADEDEGYDTHSFWRYLAERNAAIRRREDLPGPQWARFDYTFLDILLDSTPPQFGDSDKVDSPAVSLKYLSWVDSVLKESTALGVGIGVLLPDFLAIMAGFPGQRAGDVKMEKWMRELCAHEADRDLLLEEKFRLADFEADIKPRGCLSFSVDRDAALGAQPLSVTITAAADSEDVAKELSLGEAGGQRVMHRSLSAGCSSGGGSCEVSWTWLLDSPEPRYFVMTAVRAGAPDQTTGKEKLGVAVSTGGVDVNVSEPRSKGNRGASRREAADPGPGGAMDTARQRIEESSTRLTNNGAFTGTVSRNYFDDGGGELVIRIGTAHGYGDVLGSTLGAGGILRQALGTGQLIGEYYSEIMAAELQADADRMQRDGVGIVIRIPLIDYGFEGQIDDAGIRVTQAGGGWLIAMGPRDIDPAVDFTRFPSSGKVTIEQFSPALLKGRFSGELVEPYDRQRETRDRQRGIRHPVLEVVRNIEGRFWISGPWQYDDRYESIMDEAEMAEWLSGDLVEIMRGAWHGQTSTQTRPRQPGDTGSPTSPGGAGQGGGELGCKCTCEEYAELEVLGKKLEGMGEMDPDAVASLSQAYMTASMCTAICIQEYGACY